MDETSLKNALAGLPLAGICYFETISSTNLHALELAESGAPGNTLLVANAQSAGRGRLNRQWVTLPGSALAFSLLLRPLTPDGFDPLTLALYSPLGALAVSHALGRKFGVESLIKWPNDVLLPRRDPGQAPVWAKACGILAETSLAGNRVEAVVLGIGINVGAGAVPPPDQVLFPATSVEQARRKPVERLELLSAVLENIFAWRERLATPEFMAAWEKLLAFRGEWVQIERSGRPPLNGRLLGLALNGDLRLLSPEEGEVFISAGDVRLRPLRI